MITIRHLMFSRPHGEFAMNIPRLTVDRGESVVLTGPSGSGKTTLLDLAAGILQAQSGSIIVDGQDLTAMTEPRRRSFRLRRIGLVFQSFELIEYLSVIDNVLLPARISPEVILDSELRSRAARLLECAGLDRLQRRSVTQLSQGEQQRVAVCRALLMEPPLLLADEPTGNLDPDNSRRIMDLLLDQVRRMNTTLLAVTHDHTMLSRFDRALKFQDLLVSEQNPAEADRAS